MLGTLIKASLVDYPRHVAATYFLSGCNIRCPYCYNGALVLGQISKTELQSFSSVLEHLNKRKNMLTGFVLSGGEPLLYPEIAEAIKEVKKLGYKVKLDTNGLFPERLSALFNSPETTPDYIALDIKTSPDKYHLLKFTEDANDKLKNTIDILRTLPTEHREFRTVLCPPLVTNKDIKTMAKILPKDARWFFAPFRNENCLDPQFNKIQPFTDNEMIKIVQLASKIVVNSMLR